MKIQKSCFNSFSFLQKRKLLDEEQNIREKIDKRVSGEVGYNFSQNEMSLGTFRTGTPGIVTAEVGTEGVKTAGVGTEGVKTAEVGTAGIGVVDDFLEDLLFSQSDDLQAVDPFEMSDDLGTAGVVIELGVVRRHIHRRSSIDDQTIKTAINQSAEFDDKGVKQSSFSEPGKSGMKDEMGRRNVENCFDHNGLEDMKDGRKIDFHDHWNSPNSRKSNEDSRDETLSWDSWEDQPEVVIDEYDREVIEDHYNSVQRSDLGQYKSMGHQVLGHEKQDQRIMTSEKSSMDLSFSPWNGLTSDNELTPLNSNIMMIQQSNQCIDQCRADETPKGFKKSSPPNSNFSVMSFLSSQPTDHDRRSSINSAQLSSILTDVGPNFMFSIE